MAGTDDDTVREMIVESLLFARSFVLFCFCFLTIYGVMCLSSPDLRSFRELFFLSRAVILSASSCENCQLLPHRCGTESDVIMLRCRGLDNASTFCLPDVFGYDGAHLRFDSCYAHNNYKRFPNSTYDLSGFGRETRRGSPK